MKRDFFPVMGLFMTVTAVVIGLGLLLHYQVFKQTRLASLEQTVGQISLELRASLEGELAQGVSLENASTLLLRVAALEAREQLIARMLVVRPDATPVFRFDARQSGREPVPEIKQAMLLGALTRMKGAHQAPAQRVGSLSAGGQSGLLHLATVIRDPLTSEVQGILLVGMKPGIGWADFLLRGNPVVLMALGLIYLAGLVGWIVTRRLTASATRFVYDSDTHRLACDSERLERAYEQLGELARFSPRS